MQKLIQRGGAVVEEQRCSQNSVGLRGGDRRRQGRVRSLQLHGRGCLLLQLREQAASEDTFGKWSNASFMLREVFWPWAQAWWASSSNSYQAGGSSLTSSCWPGTCLPSHLFFKLRGTGGALHLGLSCCPVLSLCQREGRSVAWEFINNVNKSWVWPETPPWTWETFPSNSISTGVLIWR